MTLTRRTGLLLGAGALAAPFVLRGARPALAAADMMGASRPDHMRFVHGDFEVTTLFDGFAQMPGPHPIFGQDQEAAEVAALMEANNLRSDRMEIGFTTTLVNTGRELVLFDTGNDATQRATAGKTREHLMRAGYTPEDVDIVVLTHFHGDHIGGMMTDGKATYPNARYVTNAIEYDHWIGAENEGVLARVKPFSDRMTFVKDGEDVVSGITAMAAYGHTPGHTIYHVESSDKRVLVTADAANHFVASLERPDWHVRFDMDKEAAAATRKRVFGMLAAEGIPFIGYHMPYPAVGFVKENGMSGFDYTPADSQVFIEG